MVMVRAELEALRAGAAKLARKAGQPAEVGAIMCGVDAAAGPKKLRSAGWHADAVTGRQPSSQRGTARPQRSSGAVGVVVPARRTI
jgi:hypothetical protein